MRLELTIDELVLRGVAHEHAHAVAGALEERLAALAEGPTSIPPRAEAFRRLPAVEAPTGDPAALGAGVADAVWSTISRPGGGR